jgi:RNA polymerase sigma factor (sigma-70 family)
MGAVHAVRRLTPEQQGHAERGLEFVHAAVAAFVRSTPSYRRLFRHADLDGAARLAVVQAALTYDPSKSLPQTYFSAAVRHALLKEVRRVQRSRLAADERIELPRAVALKGKLDTRDVALECLGTLPPYSRSVVQRHVLDGMSLTAIARQDDVDWRTVRDRLTQAFDQLHSCAGES